MNFSTSPPSQHLLSYFNMLTERIKQCVKIGIRVKVKFERKVQNADYKSYDYPLYEDNGNKEENFFTVMYSVTCKEEKVPSKEKLTKLGLKRHCCCHKTKKTVYWYGAANLRYLGVSKRATIVCSTEELAFVMGNLMVYYKHLFEGDVSKYKKEIMERFGPELDHLGSLSGNFRIIIDLYKQT